MKEFIKEKKRGKLNLKKYIKYQILFSLRKHFPRHFQLLIYLLQGKIMGFKISAGRARYTS
jgi:hypothetical protein